MASVSASDVSDINDNQNYLSESEVSVSGDLNSQYEDLATGDSDSVGSGSDVIDNSNSGSDVLSDATDTDGGDSTDGSGDSSETPTKNGTNIVSSSSTVVNGYDYSVTLKDKNGNVLSGKKLIFTFNGKSYTRTTNSKGVASLTINNVKAGSYTIGVIFEGDELYENSSLSTKITVSKTPTTIANSTNEVVRGRTYSVVLKDKKGNPLSSKAVTLTYNGKTYKLTTNSKGIVSFTITGTVGKTYKLTYKFAGDSYYAASSGYRNLKVKMPTKIVGTNARIVKGTKYNITLRDSNNRALSKRTVAIIYRGNTYKRTTNSRGVISFYLNPTPGKSYDITYKYGGTSYYGSSSKTVSVFIKTPTKIINTGSSVGKGRYYHLFLKDYNGKALPNRTVIIKYRGVTYKKVTNAIGDVGVKINSGIGYTYKLTYRYAGTNYYGPSSGSVNLKTKMATTLTGSSSTIIKGNTYKVTLKDGNGRALSRKTVTFVYNGNTYKRTTDSKGSAGLTISSPAGKTYKLSYTYAGDSYYNRSSSGSINLGVKLSSSIKNSGNAVMNNSSYSVSLKDNEGKVISGKTVSFTMDGKTYKNTTDSNGVARLFVVESSPKTTKLTYSFSGDNLYTASSGSVNLNIKSDKIFTFNQISAAASNLRTYVENNGCLPSTVSVNGVNVNTTVFAYLMAKSVINVNNGKKLDVEIVNVSSNFTNGGSSSINADLNKANYIALCNQLINNISSGHKLPDYINTSIGKVSPNLYIFGLSKALDFYYCNNRLPNYVTLKSSDVSGTVNPGGSASPAVTSQFKKGLNEIQYLTSAQLAKYLSASGNDAINAQIQNLANQLTAGKTSVWAKAEAIFNWVRDNVDYEYYANTKYKATGTLANKRGNCCDHANLIVALCRAADIPARFSHGKNCVFSSGLNTGHVWAQIYVDGVWYSADATSSRNKLGNIQNWNTNSFTLQEYDLVHLSF